MKSGNKRIAERRATLFDGVLVLSKRKRSVQTSGPAGASGAPVEYKLKDQIHTRKVEIKDREDTEGKAFMRLFGTLCNFFAQCIKWFILRARFCD